MPMVSLASNMYTSPEGRQDAPGFPLGPLTTSPSFLRSIVHVLTSPEAGLTLSWKMPFVFLMAAFRSASDILENESARLWCARSGGREQTREDQPQEGRPGKRSETDDEDVRGLEAFLLQKQTQMTVSSSG